jgi:glutaredoxin
MSATSPEHFPARTKDGPKLVVYWRPGCPYCGSLRRALHRAGIETTEIDIWKDPRGAAVVRAATGGDETVPTVALGDTVMVNPAPRDVIARAAAAGVNIHEPPSPWWRRRRRSDARST